MALWCLLIGLAFSSPETDTGAISQVVGGGPADPGEWPDTAAIVVITVRISVSSSPKSKVTGTGDDTTSTPLRSSVTTASASVTA